MEQLPAGVRADEYHAIRRTKPSLVYSGSFLRPGPLPLMSIGYANLNQAILDAMDQYSAESCFQAKRGGRFRELSYRYFRRQTLRR